MGSTISIICCARLESQPCCQFEEDDPEDLLSNPTSSYQTLLPDT